jgi:hypothetical protein
MEAIVPLAGLKSTTIQNLVPGSLYYTINQPVTGRSFRMRVELEGAVSVGMVFLDGNERFNLGMLRGGDANAEALHVPVQNLHVRLGMGQAENLEFFTPGNLFVTPDEAFILVSMPGIGGATTLAYLSTSTWRVTRQPPATYAMFSQWQLLARKPHEDEVILSVGGLE